MSRPIAAVALVFCLALPAHAQSVAPQAAPPITISTPTTRWISFENFADMTMANPVEVHYELGTYTGKKLKVVMEASVKDEKTGEVRTYTFLGMDPEPVKKDKPTIFGTFVMSKANLTGIGELTIYLMDEKAKVELSNRITIPSAAGEDAIKQLTAKLGPPEVKP